MSRASLKTTEQLNAVNGVARHDHQVGVSLTSAQHRNLARIAQARRLYSFTLAASLTPSAALDFNNAPRKTNGADE